MIRRVGLLNLLLVASSVVATGTTAGSREIRRRQRQTHSPDFWTARIARPKRRSVATASMLSRSRIRLSTVY
jgi:hypothetical protein